MRVVAPTVRLTAMVRQAASRATLTDAVTVLVIAAVGLVDTLTGDYSPRGLWVAGALATAGALALRRSYPLATLPAVLAPWFALSFTDPPSDPSFPFFATAIACFSAGFYAPLRPALAGLAFVVAFFAGGAAIDGDTPPGDVAFISFIVAGVWLLGRVLRGRTQQAHTLERHAELLESEREAHARASVEIERARIARELHDVIAHGISVMVLQVGGVRRLLGSDRAREQEVLSGVEAIGREALDELRLLLGMLREDGAASAEALEPQPGLGRLESLAASLREAGLDVELLIEGEARSLPRGLELSAYRIVQEALTNVLKHARAGRVEVCVRYGRRRLELDVTDDGAGVATGNGNPGGHGIVGMRERAGLFGGELRAAPAAGGGFCVHAVLPLDGAPVR